MASVRFRLKKTFGFMFYEGRLSSTGVYQLKGLSMNLSQVEGSLGT